MPVPWWLLAFVLLAVPAGFAQNGHEAIEGALYLDKTEAPRDSPKELLKNIVLDQEQIWNKSIPDDAPEREMVADVAALLTEPIEGLMYGGTLLHMTAHWTAVSTIVLLGFGILTGAKFTRQKDSAN